MPCGFLRTKCPRVDRTIAQHATQGASSAIVAADASSQQTARHGRRHHRQRARMVRLLDLRLFRRRDRPRFLSGARAGEPGAGGIRRVRRRLPDAAAGRHRGRPYRRPLRPHRGAQRLRRGDGAADLPGRHPAGLRNTGIGRAGHAHAPAHDPGPVGRRRMHHRLHLPGRAGGTRTARCGGRRRIMRGHGRHAAGLGDGRRLLRPAVAR